jgi:hypothetical protein
MMKNKGWYRRGFCLIIVLPALVLPSCKSVRGVKKIFGEALMYGMIYDGENMSVMGVEINIDGKLTSTSDVQGRFVLVSAKRNTHNIILAKPGYETTETTITFDPMEVMHFTMLNASQLAQMAEDAMEERRFKDAFDFCNRALNLEPDRTEIIFLKSLALFRQKKYVEARHTLEYLQDILGRREYIDILLQKIKNAQIMEDEK